MAWNPNLVLAANATSPKGSLPTALLLAVSLNLYDVTHTIYPGVSGLGLEERNRLYGLVRALRPTQVALVKAAVSR